MAATGRDAPAQSAMADREIVISRVISAPRELVFEAFTEVRHLSRWWGPEGFTTTATRAFEFRVGGEWEFVLHGPDGTDYQEWILVVIEKNLRPLSFTPGMVIYTRDETRPGGWVTSSAAFDVSRRVPGSP